MDLIPYFAGFFDGEGSICVHLHQRNAKALVVNVSANQVDPRPLILLKEKYGGSLFLTKNASPSGKVGEIWKWQLVSAQAEPFLQDIYPWVIVKKHQVEIALQVREAMKKDLRKKDNKDNQAEILSLRENLYKQARGAK